MTSAVPPQSLKRVRKAASGIKGLTVKLGANGRLLWYWEPNRREKLEGWKPLAFSDDQLAAQAGALARNAEIETLRNGSTADFTGKVTRAPIKTLGDHALLYERNYLAHLSVNHQKNARAHLKRICSIFGDIAPNDIRPEHIGNWTDRMRGRGKWTEAGRQVSDTTANNHLRTYHALQNWIKNPYPKFGQGKSRDAVWEAEDEAAFIAAAYDLGLPGMALAMKLAIYTAARQSDLIGFTEAQLQPMRWLIDPQVKAALVADDGKIWGWQFIPSKSSEYDNVVQMHIPIMPDLLGDLRKALARNRARARAEGRLVTHILVNDRSGQPWQQRHFIRTWNEVRDHAVTKTGRTTMDALHWHDLRRTRVVRLKRQGLTHDRIAQLTGHSPKSVDAIMKVYGPVDSNMTARVIVDGEKKGARG